MNLGLYEYDDYPMDLGVQCHCVLTSLETTQPTVQSVWVELLRGLRQHERETVHSTASDVPVRNTRGSTFTSNFTAFLLCSELILRSLYVIFNLSMSEFIIILLQAEKPNGNIIRILAV